MQIKNMTNAYIVAILKTMNDETGVSLLAKRLPTKLLYALRRSLQEVNKAYNAYAESMADICKRYGATPDRLVCADPEQQQQMVNELSELLHMEVQVSVYTIAPEVLDSCGEGAYDSLTYTEMDRIWWLVNDE